MFSLALKPFISLYQSCNALRKQIYSDWHFELVERVLKNTKTIIFLCSRMKRIYYIYISPYLERDLKNKICVQLINSAKNSLKISCLKLRGDKEFHSCKKITRLTILAQKRNQQHYYSTVYIIVPVRVWKHCNLYVSVSKY